MGWGWGAAQQLMHDYISVRSVCLFAAVVMLGGLYIRGLSRCAGASRQFSAVCGAVVGSLCVTGVGPNDLGPLYLTCFPGAL